MPRPTTKVLTEAEQRWMEALCEMEKASVREVAKALSKQKATAYNTVLTIPGILHRKKYIKFRRDGRAHVYRSAVSKTNARLMRSSLCEARRLGRRAIGRMLISAGASQ